MREDMAKVLVERPRMKRRFTLGPAKGYRKRLRRQLDSDDSPPAREGMKVRGGNTKSFNEHLSPLRRFLDSNVGRPWDKVYGEICSHVDRGNVVQKHILTHLFDYVVTKVILIDGRPCNGEAGRRYGEPLRESENYYQWYVCPKSGLLRRSRHVRRQKKRGEPRPRIVRVSPTEMCLERNCQWELLTVAPLPEEYTHKPGHDIVRKKHVYPWSKDEARHFYGAPVYATSRRPLSKRELKQLPVPIDWIR
jgi:hypothetical protein